ncbi:MAG: quinone-dependent dihydroorotate dehydrogenase [Flaviaesturariibacter sp.]|nr:quinone-dependent dihydroorotate dehydrogenase [Flaviaesturariibacter sp.]
MYALLRKLFFLLPAETAHGAAMTSLRAACAIPLLRRWIRSTFTPAEYPVAAFGLSVRNPVGLGAGFDKNARYLDALEALGFGFVEIGTVTPRPQAGNDKPRLFRLVQDKALINRMGFNNDGVAAVALRLARWRANRTSTGDRPSFLVGGNIGKNKATPNEEAWRDYETCFTALRPSVDFFVVNVSSPNTPGLRALQEKEALRGILIRLQDLNRSGAPQRPILLKIAPDLDAEAVDDVIDLAQEIGLDGLVVSNTTINRSGLQATTAQLDAIGMGGVSGAPLRARSTELLSYIHGKAPSLPVIGSGGIFTAADASEKLAAGATLLEVWTGFIYEGPSIVKRICSALA